MSVKTRFINKRTMKQVNAALVEAGYGEYPGDRTTAQPNGIGSGYVANLVQYLAPMDQPAQRKIEHIVSGIINA